MKKVSRADVELIRSMRLAGDFLLWTRFARHSPLRSIPTVISGFRRHKDNMTSNPDSYFKEISDAGYYVPSPHLRVFSMVMKMLFEIISFVKTYPEHYRWNKEFINIENGEREC